MKIELCGVVVIDQDTALLASEHQRLTALGVEFSAEPTAVGSAIIAVFDDTCGTRIQLHQAAG